MNNPFGMMMDTPGSNFPAGLPPMPRNPLPDMSSLTMPPTSAFTALLFQSEYVLMLAELQALREATIGSTPLIVLIKKGTAPADLSKALTSTSAMMLAIIGKAQTYVKEAAWAEAALMHKGMLPKLPDVPIKPYIKALESTQVDWSQLWEFIERERQNGCLKGKTAWADTQGAFRTRFQRTLDALSKKFIDLITAAGAAVFPQDDALRLMPVSTIDKGLDTIEPLPAALSSASTNDTSPAGLPLPYLEALLVRGKAVRSTLATAARQEGNALFEKSKKLTGSAKHAAWTQATEKYTLSLQAEDQGDVGWSNMAAVLITAENWASARDAACMGLGIMEMAGSDPVLYVDKRAGVVQSLRTGMPSMPSQKSPKLTPAQQTAKRALQRKLYTRKARAQAGMLMDSLGRQETFTNDALAAQMRSLFFDTQQAYERAQELDKSDQSLVAEQKEMIRKYQAKMLNSASTLRPR